MQDIDSVAVGRFNWHNRLPHHSGVQVKLQFRKQLLILGPVIALLLFLLWPLGSRRWEIAPGSDSKSEKETILERQVRAGHSAPRIVIILADDLSIVDTSIYGGAVVSTPNIDSIGEEGVVFTEASCTTAICSPSRASMLTGKYQQRYGFELQPHEQYARSRLQYLAFRYFIDTGSMVPIAPFPIPRRRDLAHQGIPASEIMLSELLRARGYATAAFGKWHLGYDTRFSPIERGFDEHYGFYEAFSLYAPTGDDSIVDTPIDDFSDRHMWNRARKGASAIVHNDVEVEEESYLTFKFAELAADYIEENADAPFFLYLPFSAPHTPLQAPIEYYDRFAHIEDPVRRTYSAMIAALDDAVGTVLDSIDEAGIADSTLVVFASDNGGVTYLGVTDNGPYAGGKFSTFQGGLAVPMMMRYPPMIEPGTRYESPVSLMDIYPTVEAIARGSPGTDDEERPLDGVNLFPFIRGETDSEPHDALFWRSWYNRAVRRGPWKLIVQKSGSPDTGETDLFYLYNLERDPYEKTNLAGEQPDVVRDLNGLLDDWEADLADPAWPPVMHFYIDVWGERFWFAV